MKFRAEFRGVRTGDVYPHTFQPGDECPPELEAAAIACGVVDVPAAEPPAGDAKAAPRRTK